MVPHEQKSILVEFSDDELTTILEKLKPKDDNLQSYSFSQDHSEKMDILWSDGLKLKPDAESRAIKTDSVGADELWSADVLYRHLCTLRGLVPRKNEAAVRMWIEPFFHRLAAMTPNMVLSVKQSVPSVNLTDQSHDIPTRWVNWMAIVMSEVEVIRFIANPDLSNLKKEDSVLFISEVKGLGQLLEDYVPQAANEMYGCARIAGKDIIRGVLTNGYSWMFLLLTLNKNGGGSFLCSSELSILPSFVRVGIDKEAVSVIVAIMAYWMTHSHEALDIDDDYFTYRNA